MPVVYHIHPDLQSLDFRAVDLYDFARFIYDAFKQSIFKPLQPPVPSTFQDYFLVWFSHVQHLEKHVNFEFCEYMRQKVLLANGYDLQNGCHNSHKDVIDVMDYF